MRDRQSKGRRIPTLAALDVLTVMAVVGTSLFALRYGFDSYQQGLTRAIRFSEAAQLARTAQMDFKLQVQEWKNILLRGSDQRDYQTYLKQFEQQEAKVAEDLSRLAQLLAEMSDETNQAQVAPIQEQMKVLGSRYREALASFRSDERVSAFAVDHQVRGIDREPTTRLDELAENINRRSKEVLQEANASSQQLYGSLRTVLQAISGIAIVLTVVLAVIKSRA
jgi:type II secretory pathway pseudopilin PulG